MSTVGSQDGHVARLELTPVGYHAVVSIDATDVVVVTEVASVLSVLVWQGQQ
jgi:hypothetical protein